MASRSDASSKADNASHVPTTRMNAMRTFFPQKGASRFFTDHVGGGRGWGWGWWCAIGPAQRLSRLVGAWYAVSRWAVKGGGDDDCIGDAFANSLAREPGCCEAASAVTGRSVRSLPNSSRAMSRRRALGVDSGAAASERASRSSAAQRQLRRILLPRASQPTSSTSSTLCCRYTPLTTTAL